MSDFKEAFTFLYFPLFPSKHPSPQNQSILLKPLLRKISLPQSPSTPTPSLVNIQTSELMSPFDNFFVFIYFVLIHSTLETSTDKRDFANKIPWIHKQPGG